MCSEVKEYFDALSESRKARLLSIHALIIALYPAVEISMKYKMPTYAAGEGWVALANRKNYISLYTCGYAHIESYIKKHSQIKSGKGCINFKDKDEIVITDLKPVIKHAIEFSKKT